MFTKKTDSWKNDTDYEEVSAFLGVLFIMGIHKVPHFCDYFSEDWVSAECAGRDKSFCKPQVLSNVVKPAFS
jgi:hypothetical protein